MAKKKVEPLYVKSKIRDYINGKGLNTSSTVVDGDKLNERIMEIIDKAAERAKANKRKTVKPRDL